ncbi:MAG: 50S ribosomal protein L11 methyltransferase, partial [Clostridia bacterium]|nr:50S ribosomal protein L11 methyltransferase [Clostridia bacterium]
LLFHVDRSGGGYDVICANIVADIIIRMMPDVAKYMKPETVILASGIICERADEVVDRFRENGFEIIERVEENGWCALAVGFKKD